ncbi:ParA family protein [Nonomuraea aurantiaca]|uniref:ParA family protein n=1 Tax=Nonomuraea aurantiaca TaxID=2878562 RepID=UPI001CD9E23E|nr:ParA family protein [Nonomuraea aurantiaca]MCA2228770.1 AAA family ATPase [Nonomuraea aurantiaca]
MTFPHTASRSGALSVQEIVESIRPKLRRVIIVLNNKGGAGKTTTTANISAQLAAALHSAGSSQRVLAIDLDPQGNLGLDLGHQGTPGDDEGQSVIDVVEGTGPLHIIKDVRPQLDVVPGGKVLKRITASMIGTRSIDPRREILLSLAEALAEVAHDYEWILIDCPPNLADLQHLAAVAAEYVLIPVCFDQGAIQGLEGVSEVFDVATRLNPSITPLGVLLFGFDRQHLRKIRNEDGEVIGLKEIGFLAKKRREITEVLGDSGIPIFQTVITRAVNVADQCRKHGRVFAELADLTAGSDWKRHAKQHQLTLSTESAETSAIEMEEATAEIIKRAMELEAEAYA